MNSAERLKLAFDFGRTTGIQKEVSVSDILDCERPPWTTVMPYVLNIYHVVCCSWLMLFEILGTLSNCYLMDLSR